jgi:hypothetical protein
MMERWRFAICRTLEQAAALERHRTCSACTRLRSGRIRPTADQGRRWWHSPQRRPQLRTQPARKPSTRNSQRGETTSEG